MTPELLLHILQQYETMVYPILFMILVGEGPFASFIAAGLASQGILDIGIVTIIAYTADIIGDVFRFGTGYFGISKILDRWRRKHSTTKANKHFLHKMYQRLPFFLFLLLVKITPYLAIPGLLFLGSQHVKRKTFLISTIPLCILIRSLFLVVGYGSAVQVENMQTILQGWKYIGVAIAIFLLLFFLTKKLYTFFTKRIKKKIEQKNT